MEGLRDENTSNEGVISPLKVALHCVLLTKYCLRRALLRMP